ncbi:MAG: 2-phospho-L-lactate transferase [Sphingomonadales bacterium]|nr:2-phospho-L-lactate transferase [Sphingomonadales bacterium]
MNARGHVLALSGGVGGAKLAAGLAAVLPPERLTIAVNTGDDFEHLGLTVCPDIDSVVYALAGLNDSVRGWGVADESWQMMAMLRRLGGEDWFNLGDRDLAMHLQRSEGLRRGETLSTVTARLAATLGIGAAVVPVSDDPVRTQVLTEAGWLDFQRYFVGEQCRPVARGFRFAGAERARIAPGLAAALARDDLAGIVLCPSNPYLSIDPMLAVPGLRDALLAAKCPRIAVSPLIGGQAVKGPLAKLIAEIAPKAGAGGGNALIANHYGALLTHLVIDRSDDADAGALRAGGLSVTVTATLMRENADRERLAREVLKAAGVE